MNTLSKIITIFAFKYRQVAVNSPCCKASISECRVPV